MQPLAAAESMQDYKQKLEAKHPPNAERAEMQRRAPPPNRFVPSRPIPGGIRKAECIPEQTNKKNRKTPS